MMNKLILLCLITFFAGALQAQVQKLGHVNSATVIQGHPAISSANSQLEAYQKSLTDPFEVKSKDFEAKYHAYVEQANSGTLSQNATQTKQAELQTLQDSLASEQDQIKFKVMQKREELLQPILTEVDSVIQLIGKEGKYTMIFDTSVSGALLFAEEADDLTTAVQARLKK